METKNYQQTKMNTIKDIFKKGGGVQIVQPNPQDAVYEQVFAGEVQEPINWEIYLPETERQGNTAFCVSFSRLNVAETMAKRDGLDFNLSDRHLGVLSGTTKSGNNLNAVSEAFRTLGIVREEYFSWKPEQLEDPSGHWTEIFDTSSIPSEARRFFGGNHSWVKNDKAIMKSALAFSPLQLALGVDENWGYLGIIPPCKNPQAYHCVMLFKIDEAGNYHIFDSVLQQTKVLDKNYPILQIKSFRDLPSDWKLSQQQIKEKTILQILGEILKKLAQVLGLMKQEVELLPTPQPPVPVIDYVPPVKPPEAPTSPPSKEWGKCSEADKMALIPQIKGICKKNRLTDQMTIDIICTIWAESGLNKFCVNETTGDYGLCQFSKKYYLIEYKMTPQEAIDNPLKCVDIMSKNFKAGRANNWIAYKNGNFLKCPAKYLV